MYWPIVDRRSVDISTDRLSVYRHYLQYTWSPFSCKSELPLRTFAANYLLLSMLGSSVWWSQLLMPSLTRSTTSSRFPHFSHRFTWSTCSVFLGFFFKFRARDAVTFSENRGGLNCSLFAHFSLKFLQNWTLIVCLIHGGSQRCRDVISSKCY